MNYKIKGLNFVQTCEACPEQYDVFDAAGVELVGYVRLRHGCLRADYPTCGDETVFEEFYGDDLTGLFNSEEDRMKYLNEIADAINEQIKKSEELLELFSAEEAKAITDSKNKKFAKTELKNLIKRIKMCAEAGKYEVNVNYHIYPENVELLKSKGYTVDKYDNTGYIISWEDTDGENN